MTAETARPARTDWTLPGLALADLTLPVPLDHADPAGPSIELFARLEIGRAHV